MDYDHPVYPPGREGRRSSSASRPAADPGCGEIALLRPALAMCMPSGVDGAVVSGCEQAADGRSSERRTTASSSFACSTGGRRIVERTIADLGRTAPGGAGRAGPRLPRPGAPPSGLSTPTPRTGTFLRLVPHTKDFPQKLGFEAQRKPERAGCPRSQDAPSAGCRLPCSTGARPHSRIAPAALAGRFAVADAVRPEPTRPGVTLPVPIATTRRCWRQPPFLPSRRRSQSIASPHGDAPRFLAASALAVV